MAKIFKKDTVNIFLNEGLKFRTALARIIIKRSCEFFRRDPYGSIENKKIFLKQEKHFKSNYYEKNQK